MTHLTTMSFLFCDTNILVKKKINKKFKNKKKFSHPTYSVEWIGSYFCFIYLRCDAYSMERSTQMCVLYICVCKRLSTE